MRMRRRRKLHFLYVSGRDDQIITSTKLLNIKYKFYGFSGDLTEIFMLVIAFLCVHVNSTFPGYDSPATARLDILHAWVVN